MPTDRLFEPTIADWAKLYQQALHFRERGPWNWLTDAHLFAVQEPDTGEVGYCSIMGAGGIEYGLVAYRGSLGLKSYALIVNDALDDDEAWLVQDCLSFYLGDRELVDKADRAVHAALGLRFRGRGAWPIFRSHRPVYLPAHLNRQEARFLATCLEQACCLVEELLSNQPLPQLLPDGVLARRTNAQGAWETTLMLLPSPPPPPALAIDEIRLEQVRQSCPKVQQTWQAGVQAVVPIIEEKSVDPYFARTLLCVDQKSSLILFGGILGPEDSLQEALLQAVERAGVIPDVVRLTSSLLETELAPLTEVLGIKVRRATRLKELAAASKALKAAFGRG